MFKVEKKSAKSQARCGVLTTEHGDIQTPFFMPVATQGAVKHITTEEMRRLQAQILLANTYHLMLRPGSELIKKAGGLHNFMEWNGPILTDSGGFQVFSLSGHHNKSGQNLVKLDRSGVKFKSYVDGSSHILTPERSLALQRELGVDIAVCLDECVALPAKAEYIAKSVELTTHWAAKTKKYWQKFKGRKPLLHAVIQGGLDRKMRLKSAADLAEIGFDGYNIGGLSVGETQQEMYAVLDYLVPAIPADKPRYLMGVGYPENILEAVKRGVDMFDCVIPTREGRHGRVFSWKSDFISTLHKERRLNSSILKKNYQALTITRRRFKNDQGPISPTSKFPPLRKLSRSYLNYLFKINEPLGQRLASLNNLEFYLDLMRIIRYSIKSSIL